MNKFRINFHLFEGEAPQQTYTPLNPNWTGQANVAYAQQADGSYRGGTYTANQDLTPEMKTFYDKNLIRLAGPKMIHDQFGQKRPIPAGNGKTIEFRQFKSLPAIPADRELVEGITPTGQNYGVTAKTATIKQYGGYITVSDMLNLVAYDPQMKEIMDMLAEQAGKVSDIITRDIIQAGTNVMFAGGKSARSGLTSSDKLTIRDLRKAVRLLKRVDAPTIDGDYVALIHPDISFDLMDDSAWVDANHYAGSSRIFEGEIGKMYGLRFVESSMAKIWKASTSGAVPVYGTIVLGRNAFGVTSINGGGIETIVKQLGSGGTADPLNQRSTVGWKLNKTAKILTEEYMVRIESTSDYQDAVAN